MFTMELLHDSRHARNLNFATATCLEIFKLPLQADLLAQGRHLALQKLRSRARIPVAKSFIPS